jgi:hypothetical protein
MKSFCLFVFSLPEVQLGPKELRELQDFEEDCMDDLSRRKCRQTTLATSHNSGQQQEQQWQHQIGSRSNLLI